MKKFIIALAIITSFVAGFAFGTTAMDRAPKWIEEDCGIVTIHTEFMGQTFDATAKKSSAMYDEFVYCISRR